MLISSLCSKSLISTSASFPLLLVPCGFYCISLSVTFISSLMLLLHIIISLSILMTSVLNSASDRLPSQYFTATGFESLVSWSVSPISPVWPAALLRILSVCLPVSTPPTSLDECFFNSLIVGVPCSLISWQF